MVCLIIPSLSVPSSISTNAARQATLLLLAGCVSLPSLLPAPSQSVVFALPVSSRHALVGIPDPAESSLVWLYPGEMGDLGR